MAAVDSLEVIIETKAQDTAKSLNNLVKQLGLIAEGINAIGSNTGLNEFAKKAQEATKSFANIQNAAKGLSNSITPEIQKVSKSFDEIAAKYKDLGKGFKFVGSTSAIQKQIDSYTNSLERAKLKKEELEAGDKTGGQGYEDAIKDIQKYENIIASLKNQLAEMQTGKISFDTSGMENVENLIERMKEQIRQSMEGVRIENPIDLTSLSEEDFSTFMRLKSEMERAGMAAEQMGGQIREAVNIPASAFNFNSNAMAATFGEAARNIENLSQAAQVFGENAGQALNDLPNPEIRINGIEEAGNRLREFGERLNQLVVPEIREDNLDKLQSSLSKTELKLEELRTKLENGLTMGHITESVDDSGFVRLQEQIAYTEKQAEALRNRIAEVGNSGGAGGIERFQTALSKLSAVGKTAISALSGVASAIKKMGSIIGTAISKVAGLGKSFLGLGKSSKSTSVSLAGGFKTILKYTLGIRSLYVLVGKLRRAMKEAFSNLAQYSSETNASLSMLTSSLGALKNSLAVAFAPIVNMIAPYISAFIDMLTRAFNAVGRFFAALTGKSFAVQAVKNFKNYAAGVSKAGGAAKKAGKDAQQGIRAFDELKTISINKDEGADSGGGGGGEVSPSDMFTTVPIEGAMKEFADKVRGILGGIFDVYEQAWESKGKSVIDSAKSALSSLGTSALSVGKTFYDVFTNGTGLAWLESSLELLRSMFDVIESISTAFSTAWNSGAGFENVTALFTMFTNINGLLTSIGDSFSRVFSNGTGAAIWTNILGIITGVYNIIGNLAKSIQTAWDAAGLGDSIWQGILNIVNIILGTLHNIVDSTAEWAEQLDFTPILTSIDTLLKAIEPLTENIGEGLEWFWNNVILPIAAWTIEDAVPTFLDMLSAAITTVNEVIEVFEPLGTWLWDNFLQPIGRWAGDVVIAAMETITDLLAKFSDWISKNQSLVEEFTVVIGSFFAAWGVVNLATTIAGIVSSLTAFITTGGLAASAAGVLGTAIGFLTSPITIAVAIIGSLIVAGVLLYKNWDKIKESAGKLKEWLAEKWDAIKEKTSEVWNGIKDKISSKWEEIKTKTKEKWNSIKSDLSEKWEDLKAKSSDTFGNIKKTISDKWSDIKSNTSSKWDSVKDKVAGVFDKLKSKSAVSDTIKDTVVKAWKKIKSKTKSIWDGIKDVIKDPINAIIGFINKMISGIASGINGLIGMLNKFKVDIPEGVPLIGGKTVGFNLSTITAPEIPYLAKGAVFKGGNPFLAVVNDQKRGQTNVETPLKVIQEALREELSKFSVNVHAEVMNARALNYRLHPKTVPSYAGAYGNYQYDTSAYATSRNNSNSDMSNAIENAVYKATYNAVSSAINNSKTLGDIKEEVRSGHVIQLDSGKIAGEVRKEANNHFRRTGRAWIDF